MAKQYTVTQSGKLLPFLFEALSVGEGWSKKTVKQRLQGSAIYVNGVVQTRHDHLLSPEDIITIGTAQHNARQPHNTQTKLEIIHQDSDLIAINKPAGLLSVGTTKENKNHALALLRTQLSRSKRNAEHIKLWPVHRLDRDTSGILLFATSKEIREAVMEHWADTEKTYLAIVEGTPTKQSDTITQPLRLDETEYRMHVGAHRDAKLAITHYTVRETKASRSLLEIRIETGRQHQIRAHMAWLGHPIIGDERYGKAPIKQNERMGLHAMRLAFVHPMTRREVVLEVDAPVGFYGLL
jgi:23S rRNA pseudouridine1911/1915/1917 synthase